MVDTNTETTGYKLTEDQEQWLQIRKEEAQKIDPDTAEVTWEYGQILDPYGLWPDVPEECYQTGRVYFARAPGSDIWVCFYDLPKETHQKLWERHKRKLAFPAGLFDELPEWLQQERWTLPWLKIFR